jgi:hypothetical protein
VITVAELERYLPRLDNHPSYFSRERSSEATVTYRRENLVSAGVLIFRGGDPG